ncbi:unnamed protein product [Didymodactylos carnosus]|uniref:Fucosyltransferase n=1 Tax=Didymodactylos carnosus TaxID=1234261 RepID=A0A815T3K0_9BILA|nr:unnamed protein product [Didymodactylos carnosus]CAF1500135.1 unnamed protein product [Didymodactylos carnosus]CAF4252567.1 unnamed protein product [Didymodactylos carnosus]CAF4361942.1 unnamed protein product [Didymodactylos carnosus]
MKRIVKRLVFIISLLLFLYFWTKKSQQNDFKSFNFSSVIYPSPYDDKTTLIRYFEKTQQLIIDEEKVSIAKNHKIVIANSRSIPDSRFLLLEYTKIFGQEKFCSKSSLDIFSKQCPYQNCDYTCNHSRLNEAQLVLFHKYDVKKEQMPTKRNIDQVWLLWHDEPLFLVSHDFNQYLFNWTTSYIFNSEISFGAYGLTLLRNDNTDIDFEQWINEQYEKRLNQASWFVTNCGAKRRLDYYYRLRQYFPIIVHGTCVDKQNFSSCPRFSSCETDQLKSTKFYLAFESQTCKDYITEKFWRALKYGTIPIALGPLMKQSYERIAPPNSFIYVGDYETPQLLAQHLYEIVKNKNIFRKYHLWRKYYWTGYSAQDNEQYRFCEVCYKLNTVNSHIYYTNIHEFFSDQC